MIRTLLTLVFLAAAFSPALRSGARYCADAVMFHVVKGRIRMNCLKSNLFFLGCVLGLCSHAWAAALTFGQTETGTISSAAQSNSYTFSANANDVVDFTIVTTTGKLSPRIELYNPMGALISLSYSNDPGACLGGPVVEMNTVTLTTAGAYTAIITDCFDTNTGGYTIFAQRTNNPAGAGSLSFGGIPQTGTINSVAQANSYTFSANANDVVNFTIVTTAGKLSPRIELYNPMGALVSFGYSNDPGACLGGSAVEMNTVALKAGGTYTALVTDCFDTNSGSYTIFTQRTNNPFGAANLLFGGQPQTGAIISAAQSNSYTFSANANDVVDFTIVTTSGKLSPRIELYNPAGALISFGYSNDPGACLGGATVEMNNVTLPATGPYALLVTDCFDTNSGSYNLSGQCFPPDGCQPLQPPPSCSLASSGVLTFGDGGGSGTVNFSGSTPPCSWSITGAPSWITLSASSGTEPGFSFTVAPNPPPGPTRQATLSINSGELTVAITETGLVCTYTLTDATAGFGASRSFPSSGGTGSINVVTPAGCGWTATPSQSFISIPGNASGNGNGSVGYSVAPDTGSNPQTGTITIAGLAYAINEQSPAGQVNSCSANSVGSGIRPEGFAEKVADIVLMCSGQAPPGGVTGDILVSFNTGVTANINVTNRLLSAGQTDALLLEDEPTATNLALGTNAFRGVISSVNGTPAILFPAMQLASVSGGAFSHTWRIANARVNAQALGKGSTVQATVSITATAPFAVSTQPTVAFTSQSSTFAVSAPTTASGQTTQPVSFTEGFDTAFEPRLETGQDPSQVGTVYNSESGYVNTAVLGTQTGFATSGTRLIVAIANVPAGVSVYAPVAPTSGASGTNAVLVSADASGTGGSPMTGTSQLICPIGPQVNCPNPATATWEMTASNPTTLETLTFNLILANPSAVSLAGITYAGALAPVSSGPAPQLPSTNLTPVPRFASSTVAVPQLVTVGLSVAPQSQVAQGQSQGAAMKPSLRSEATPSNSVVGGAVTWMQIQANTGAAGTPTAPNVSVGGTLPPTWVITACTAVDSGGVCPTINPNNPSSSYTVSYPSLSPGQTGTIMLTAESIGQSAGAVEYTSTIDSDVANTNTTAGSFTTNFTVSQIGLNVTLTNASNFTQGQTGARYSVTVANGGSLPTSLPVTVTETLPASLTLASMAGAGWTCTISTSSCTRNDVLGANSSYPSITVTVNVASSAPGAVTNEVVATTGVLQATGSDVTNITQGAPAAFFTGEVSLGSGVYYLQFSNGIVFGYYNIPAFPIFYHYDMGFEAFIDGGNGAAYLYDFSSGHWFYTSSSLFPYLYDFNLNNWLYYFPATSNPGHYTTNPRMFSDLTTGKIITM